VPWALVALGLIVVSSNRQTEKRKVRLDIRSTVLLALGIGCLQMGFLGSNVDFRFLIPGIGLLVLFIMIQLKLDDPVFNPRFFRRPAYLAAGCTTALANFTMYAMLFQLPIFFHDIRAVSELEIVGALTAMTLCMMLGGPLSGVAGRYIGIRYTAVVAACTNLFGLYLFSDLASALVPGDIIVAMALMGFAGGMAGPVVQSAGMLAIEKENAGMAAGGLSTMRYFGGAIGILVLSLQLNSSGVTTIDQHLSIIPFYAVSLTLVLLVAFLLPVSFKTQRKQIRRNNNRSNL